MRRDFVFSFSGGGELVSSFGFACMMEVKNPVCCGGGEVVGLGWICASRLEGVL